MKNIILTVLVIAAAFIPTGCNRTHSANLGQEIDLRLGEKIDIKGQGLSILFADVLEDSRCPSNVVCIWQGRVRCNVVLSKNNSIYTETFTQSGLTPDPATENALGYIFAFSVVPYPEAGKQIASQDYRLIFTVTE